MKTGESASDGFANHAVQLYEDEQFLCESVAHFLATGVAVREPSIVIATEQHRNALLECIAAKGVDVERATESGFLTMVDARATLDQLIVGRSPQWDRFEPLIGGMMDRCLERSGAGRLRAFGEMVDILWKDGRPDAALRLEKFWRDIGDRYPLSLLCAYSMANFDNDADGALFETMCGTHDQVLPTERYARITDPESRLREISLLQQRARALEKSVQHRNERERALREAMLALQASEEALTRDIQARERSETQLRLAEERFRSLVVATAQIVWTADAGGLFHEASPTWHDFTGQPHDEARGKGWIAAVHPDDRDRVQSAWSSALRSRSNLEVECRLRRPSGEYSWVACRAAPVINEDGAVREWIGTHTDISERMRGEELRAQMVLREQETRKEAEMANRMKDEFLATLSHELRTPLNAILGWAQTLRAGGLDPERQTRALETIERNAKTQAQLIEDVLDISRIIAGKLRLRMRHLDLAGVIGAAVDSVRPAAEAKQVEITVDLDPTAGSVSGDSDRLQQVVWNLLSNAIKFTPSGGRIDVRLDRWQSRTRIRVRDTGQGIRSDFLPQVFDRFRQADASASRAQGGLGLGLSIVRQLVEMHGGRVSAESKGEGHGATFTVLLPILSVVVDRETTEATLPQKNDSTIGSALAGTRVLLVDDEPDARDLLKIVLEGHGALVRAAGSAAEALETLKAWGPHVLVSDIGLPGEDGYQLIKKVRALPIEQSGWIPAVALTAFASNEDTRRAMMAGFQMHVRKPVEPARLVQVIAELTHWSRAGSPFEV